MTCKPTEGRDLRVRLARDAGDVAAAQRLRWRVFKGHDLLNASPSTSTALDADCFDDFCDHLLVVDTAADGEELVVGTYRLLRETKARDAGGFYTQGEFELSGLTSPVGELLELGRSCVLPSYRDSATIALLWRGIADYVQMHQVGLLFGCASFPGTDVSRHATSLSWLHHHHLAEPGRRPTVRATRGVRMDLLECGTYDARQAMLALPPLIKGYLRAGAKVGEGAFIDPDFDTIDVCVVMPVEGITNRYAARFRLAV